MKIAILITNTDFSDFAKARPHDGKKFRDLMQEVRPDWELPWFWVCKGEFPRDINAYDGFLITGSPASVGENTPWMQRLSDVIHDIIAARKPLFGACFGHQIIATTLGASLMRNPNGWGHGLLGIERVRDGAKLALYGSHTEQVAALPDGATLTYQSPDCAIAGYRIGDHVSTIQHHPEMTAGFIADLVEEYADYVGPDVTANARASLQRQPDRKLFAEEMARFFEGAQP